MGSYLCNTDFNLTLFFVFVFKWTFKQFLPQKPPAEGQHCWSAGFSLARENCLGTRKAWFVGKKNFLVFKKFQSSDAEMWNSFLSISDRFLRKKKKPDAGYDVTFTSLFLSSSVLGELCGARTVLLALDGLYLHSALQFFGRVPVEASWSPSHKPRNLIPLFTVNNIVPWSLNYFPLQAFFHKNSEKEADASVWHRS